MKASIITVCFNSEDTIKKNIQSVFGQNSVELEHIFIDGGSSDSTVDIINSYKNINKIVISEPDNGIYDAMNKGFHLSSGDFIGFLNSDDVYFDDRVIFEVADLFKNTMIGYVYGDIVMNQSDGKIIRYWRSGFVGTKGLVGRQLPHPAFFVRRTILERFSDPFDASYRISADLKQQLLIINKFHEQGAYIQRPLVRMALGGASTGSLRGYLTGWSESIRAYNDIFHSGGLFFTFRKVLSKIRGINFINIFKNI